MITKIPQKSGMSPVLALDSPMLLWLMHAREREKERKREKRTGKRERERERGRGRPGQREEKEKEKQHDMCKQAPDPTERQALQSWQAQAEKKKKENPGRPQEKKGGRRRRKRREEEKGGTGNNSPRGPKTAKKSSLSRVNNPCKNAHPKPTNTPPRQNTEFVAQNPPVNKTVTKIELRKPRLRKGELFSSPFSGRKIGIFGTKNPPRKTPDSQIRVRGEKPSEQKPKTDRTLKSRKSKREGLQKRILEKTDSISP